MPTNVLVTPSEERRAPGHRFMRRIESMPNNAALRLALALLATSVCPIAAQVQRSLDSVAVVSIPRNTLYTTDPVTGGTVPDTAVRITLIIRDAARPDVALSEAFIILQRLDPPAELPALGAYVDSHGTLLVEHPTPGSYDVSVRRIGYAALRFRIRVAPTCREAIEAYLAPSTIILERPIGETLPRPTIHGRVTFTTCTPPP
jgi:hypothetical protein